MSALYSRTAREENVHGQGRVQGVGRFGVTDRDIEQALGRVKVSNVDYADLYFEYCQSGRSPMEEGIVKRATKSIGQGVGVRATAGENRLCLFR